MMTGRRKEKKITPSRAHPQHPSSATHTDTPLSSLSSFSIFFFFHYQQGPFLFSHHHHLSLPHRHSPRDIRKLAAALREKSGAAGGERRQRMRRQRTRKKEGGG